MRDTAAGIRPADRERGGIVTGWLARIAVGIALAGVLLIEAGAIIVTIVNADNAAQSAAREAVVTYAHSHDRAAAQKSAERQAAAEGATLVEFSADASGAGGQSRVTVTVRKRARTIFVHRIGFLKRFTTATATNTAYSV